MVHVNNQNPNQTGYEYFNEAVAIYFRAYEFTKAEVIQKPDPIWLKGRKNKRDNFKLK